MMSIMKLALSDTLKKARNILVGSLFPAVCVACRTLVGSHGSLCSECWKQIYFISEPFCYVCGLPFDYSLGKSALCGTCLKQKPSYTQARALFTYNEFSKNPILSLKYHDRTQLAPVFGAWLRRLALPYQPKVAAILPVPLHYSRLVKRRYNQAALLADTVGESLNITVMNNALLRSKKTPPQAGLSKRQREANMRGAFMVSPAKKPLLKGKSVILVDDVMTTGATLEACARCLHDAGVVDVFVITIARTVLTG